MKSLKPSMREKKRYLLLKGENLKKNVEKAVLEGIGVIGSSKSGMSWIKNNVLSVNREVVNNIRACFAIFPEKISVIRVSGTLKGLKKG